MNRCFIVGLCKFIWSNLDRFVVITSVEIVLSALLIFAFEFFFFVMDRCFIVELCKFVWSNFNSFGEITSVEIVLSSLLIFAFEFFFLVMDGCFIVELWSSFDLISITLKWLPAFEVVLSSLLIFGFCLLCCNFRVLFWSAKPNEIFSFVCLFSSLNWVVFLILFSESSKNR